MGMFGGLAKKRNPFDFTPPVYTTPGIGDDLPGAKPMGDPGLGMAVDAAPPQKGGGWRDVLGVISEGLAGAAGNGPGVYMQTKMRDKEMQRQDSLYQRQRQQGMQDWIAKEKYKDLNPDHSEFERRLIAGGTLPGTPEWVAANKAAALNTYDPIINASVGGRDFFGPRSLLQSEITKGGDPVSGEPGVREAPASSSDGPFMSVGQYKAMRESMGAGYDTWSKKYGVPVKVATPDDLQALPVGTIYIGPDNIKRRK